MNCSANSYITELDGLLDAGATLDEAIQQMAITNELDVQVIRALAQVFPETRY